MGPRHAHQHGVELVTLHLARVCVRHLLDGTMPSAHDDESLAWLGVRETHGVDFCREVIVPTLAARAEHLPADVRPRPSRASAA